MAYQTGKNILVAFKLEGTPGTPAGATGATVFRPVSGAMQLDKRTIDSQENRRDGQTTRGRHGAKSVAGTYVGEISLGTFDALIEAMFRGTWGATLQATQADFTNIISGANSLTIGGGSWITKGFRCGDVIRATGLPDAANNAKNLHITDLTATVATIAETLVVNAAPDTAFTLDRPKVLLNPVEGSLIRRAFTIEERDIDIDASRLFVFNRVSQLRIQLNPANMARISVTFAGQTASSLTGGSSPYFTNPAATTSPPMVGTDGKLIMGGVAIADLTALDLTFNLAAQGVDVAGSGGLTPDIFEGSFRVTGQITTLIDSDTRFTQYLNETQFDLQVTFVEPEGDPQDFISFFLGGITLGNNQRSELGQEGPRTQQFNVISGIDERGGKYDVTTVRVITSAA